MVECPIRTDERRLQHVFGVIPISHHAHCEPRVTVPIAAAQERKRVHVATKRGGDELSI